MFFFLDMFVILEHSRDLIDFNLNLKITLFCLYHYDLAYTSIDNSFSTNIGLTGSTSLPRPSQVLSRGRNRGNMRRGNFIS